MCPKSRRTFCSWADLSARNPLGRSLASLLLFLSSKAALKRAFFRELALSHGAGVSGGPEKLQEMRNQEDLWPRRI